MLPVISELICIKQILSRRASGDDFAVLSWMVTHFPERLLQKYINTLGRFDKNTYLCIRLNVTI